MARRARDYLRFAVLVCACFITFGSYYCYDLPGALGNEVVAKWFNIDTVRYELLYSVYSWPNTVLAFLGGFLVDRVLGARLGAVVFTVIVALGEVFLAAGFHTHTFWLALVARFVFGLAGESIAVTQNAVTSSWFAGKELALGLAISVSFSRVGSAVNFNLTPPIAEALSAGAAVWVSLAACAISLLAAAVLFFIDRWGERNNLKPKGLIVAAASSPSQQQQQQQQQHSAGSIKENVIAGLKGLLLFPSNLWILYAAVVAFYVGVFIFMTIGSDFFQASGCTQAAAGTFLSIPYTLAAVSCPFVGIVVDLTAHHLLWMLLAVSLQELDFLLMIYTPIPPLLSMLLLGASYTIFASSVWSCIPLLVPKNQTGTAFGLAFSIQNVGLAIAPLIVGRLVDDSGDYVSAIWFFSICSITGMMLVLFMIAVNQSNNGLLNTTRARIKQAAASGEEQESVSLLSRKEKETAQAEETPAAASASTL